MTIPTSGIAGNTQQQQVSASAARGTSMSRTLFWSINLGIAVVFIGIGVILAQSGLDFAWKVLVAIGLIIIGGKLAKLKLPADITPFIWPTIVRSTGWIVLLTVLLFSGFGEIARMWGNQAEAKVSHLASTAPSQECSDDRPEPEIDDIITVTRGCELIYSQKNMAATGSTIVLVDPELDKVQREYVIMDPKFKKGRKNAHEVKLIPLSSGFDKLKPGESVIHVRIIAASPASDPATIPVGDPEAIALPLEVTK